MEFVEMARSVSGSCINEARQIIGAYQQEIGNAHAVDVHENEPEESNLVDEDRSQTNQVL